MGNILGNVVNFTFIIIGLVLAIGIVIKITVSYCTKEKCIKAIVIDKQSYDKRIYRKSEAPFTKSDYVITFLCGTKKKYFNVSEFSYRNYRVNQKGTLKYKGNRIVDFK